MIEWLSFDERQALDNMFDIDFCSGKNRLLDSYMMNKRKNRKKLSPVNTHMAFQRDNYIQVWFQTPPCRYSTRGKCTICNYWNGNRIPNLMRQVLPNLNFPTTGNTFLINTCGSCLDPVELSQNELELLLRWIHERNFKEVIFETHLHTLSENTLCRIRDALPEKKVLYEIGIESVNIDTLFYCLNKSSVLSELPSVIERIHKYRAACVANIVLGAPFLNPEEQIEDAYRSIQYLLEQKVDYLTLFPINVKPQTLPMELYENGEYNLVPTKLLAEILLKIPESELNRINLAWFGDHIEEGVILPVHCEICGRKTVDLLSRFNREDSNPIRKSLLEQIHEIDCDCIRSYMDKTDRETLYLRIRRYYSYIKKSGEHS